ncbi:MAG: hypothetical protein HY717_10005 [Planctomycetes bacterium]|nr:hypothetical protein [Planctomycetota bacterium]
MNGGSPQRGNIQRYLAEPRRQAGSMLLELTIALSVLTVGVLGFLLAFQKNFTAARDLASRDLVSAAFSNAVEQLANADFSTLYSTYQYTNIAPATGTGSPGSNVTTAGSLVDFYGYPARVLVSFDVNETALPAEYGPVGDLDGDGALTSTDCSTTYEILPTHLSLTYQTSNGVLTKHMYIVLGSRS